MKEYIPNCAEIKNLNSHYAVDRMSFWGLNCVEFTQHCRCSTQFGVAKSEKRARFLAETRNAKNVHGFIIMFGKMYAMRRRRERIQLKNDESKN